MDSSRELVYYTDRVEGIIAEISTAGVRKRKLFSDHTSHPRAIFVDSYSRYKGRIPRHRHPREDRCEDVGVSVGLDVGVVECEPGKCAANP